MVGPKWTVFAVGWPIVCGVGYALWALCRSTSVHGSALSVVYGVLVGAAAGTLLGGAAVLGGSLGLRVLRTTAVHWLFELAIFAASTALTAAVAVLILFAVMRQWSDALGPVLLVAVVGFVVAATYGPLAIKENRGPSAAA